MSKKKNPPPSIAWKGGFLFLGQLADAPTASAVRIISTVVSGRNYSCVSSITSASGAFFFTDSMPLSRAATDEYISLEPIT